MSLLNCVILLIMEHPNCSNNECDQSLFFFIAIGLFVLHLLIVWVSNVYWAHTCLRVDEEIARKEWLLEKAQGFVGETTPLDLKSMDAEFRNEVSDNLHSKGTTQDRSREREGSKKKKKAGSRGRNEPASNAVELEDSYGPRSLSSNVDNIGVQSGLPINRDDFNNNDDDGLPASLRLSGSNFW